VIVLGAGLAGLCTAYELQRLGHDVTVLEAQTRPGGRVRTLREPYPPGLYTEAGAESIPAAHDVTQHYARELGLRLVPTTVPGARSFYYVRGRRVMPGDSPVWPYDLTADERAIGLNGLFTKYVDAAEDEARAAGFPGKGSRALAAWDPLTPGAWLKGRGASAAAADLITLGFGLDFGSAASFLLHGLNSRGGNGPSFRIEGGNDNLPRAFAARIEIRYGTPVVSVKQNDRGVAVIARVNGAAETMTADRAVCALPCPVVGRILDDARISAAKQRAIREQHYSRTVKVFLQTRTRFWLKDRLSGFVETDLPIERLTPDPGADPESRGALTAYPIAGYTAALEKMSEDERVAAALDQARQIFPELSRACEGGVAQCWGLDPWQRGSFALHTPNQIGFIDVLGAAEGRIHFAGEHTSLWTGWMQGALESARRVVREVNG
jgi:monoamine oxidase